MKTITCKEAAKIISERLDHKVSASRLLLLRIHLSFCKTCAFYQKQLQSLRRVLKHYPEEIEDKKLPADKEQEIKKSLQERRP